MRNIWLLTLLCMPLVLHGQVEQKHDTAKHVSVVVPWAPIRDADVLWRKDVWRRISVLERSNWVFRDHGEASRGKMFAGLLLDGILAGKIIACDTADTTCATPLTADRINSIVRCDASSLSWQMRMYVNYRTAHAADTTDARIINPVPDPNDTANLSTCNYPWQVASYLVREEWLFDRNRGAMIVRIVAIGPEKDVDGAPQVMFWVKYPDARQYLATVQVPARAGGYKRYTWDEYFESRQFTSRIIRTSGPQVNAESSSPAEPMRYKPGKKKRHRVKDEIPKQEEER